MRVSTVRPSDADASAADRVPLRRRVLWAVVAVLLLAGVVLTFLFGRGMTPLL